MPAVALAAPHADRTSLPIEIDGQLRTLEVWEHSVRAASFRVVVCEGAGEGVAVPAPQATTLRGRVRGWDDSSAALSWRGGRLSGLILRSGEPAYELRADALTTNDAGLPVVRAGDVPRAERVDGAAIGATCGVDGSAPSLPMPPVTRRSGGASSTAMSHAVTICELGVDSDYEFYAINGSSVAQATAELEANVNVVSLIYEQEFQLVYAIALLVARTAEPDPYPDGANIAQLWTAHQTDWETNHASAGDCSHLFSGRAYIFGGYSYIGSICTANAVSVTSTTTLFPYTYRLRMVAHELGHTWGATHCNCPDDPNCHLMCGSLGLAPLIPDFGPVSAPQIATGISNATCLSGGTSSTPTPVLVSVVPSFVQALDGGAVVLKGSDLDQALHVNSGGTDFNRLQYTLQDASHIQYTPPTATAFGPVSVTVSGPGGTSNAVSLSYVETLPPKMLSQTSPADSLPPCEMNTWICGGPAATTAQLLFAYDDQTTNLGGFQVLAHGTVVKSGPVDAAGLMRYTRKTPHYPWPTFWMQAVYFNGFTVVAVSNILQNDVAYGFCF